MVGPIGDDDSDDRIHADWLLEDIIIPVFDANFKDFDVTRADKISNPGQITTQIITSLLEAELVIADLTTLNPNAFYEIGIRHMTQKPIIHMHLEGQRIPFDIAPFRSIKFSRRKPADIKAARATLLAVAEEATKPDHIIDNPVTFSRGKLELEQSATPRERVLQEQIADLTARLGIVEDYTTHPAHRDLKPTNSFDLLGASLRNIVLDESTGAVSLHVKGTQNIGSKTLTRDTELSLKRFFNAFSTIDMGVNGAVFIVPYSENNLLSMEYVREELASKGYKVSVAAPKSRES